jgi:hypothetical protein
MKKNLYMDTRRQIGKLLVDAGIITDKTLGTGTENSKRKRQALRGAPREMGIVD